MNGQIKQLDGLSLEEKRKLLADLLQQQAAEPKRAPLSFAQERLWFLTQLEPENPSYNLPFALRLDGDLDQAALEKSIDAIIARHETLRTKSRRIASTLSPPSPRRAPRCVTECVSLI